MPRVLVGLSGDMNAVRLVYRYPDASKYVEHEARALSDAEYARIAGEMSLVDGTVHYELYQQV